MKIYTPGHGIYPDTLIMYSICNAALKARKPVLLEVKGAGYYYEIEVKDLEELARSIANDISKEEENILKKVGYFTQPQEERKLRNSLVYLSHYKDCLQFLKELSAEGHAGDEGRRGGEATSPVAFTPFAGKYFTGQFNYPAKPYKLCNGCLGLLTYGFFKGTISTSQLRSKDRVIFIIFTIAFEGYMDKDQIREVLGLYEHEDSVRREIAKYLDLVPLRVLIQILISRLGRDIVRSMDEADASWRGIGVKFEKEKGRAAMEIRGLCELIVDPILNALSTIESDDYESFLRLVDELEDPTALAYLYEYLFKRNMDLLAKASRYIYQNRPMGARLAEILAKL